MNRYLLFVVSGLMTIGFGQCLILWADHLKSGGAPVGEWVLAGTGALVVFNAGLCLFGRGIVERMRREQKANVA